MKCKSIVFSPKTISAILGISALSAGANAISAPSSFEATCAGIDVVPNDDRTTPREFATVLLTRCTVTQSPSGFDPAATEERGVIFSADPTETFPGGRSTFGSVIQKSIKRKLPLRFRAEWLTSTGSGGASEKWYVTEIGQGAFPFQFPFAHPLRWNAR